MNFIYFYEPSIPKYDALIDSFFRNKYDLNKKYIRVDVNKKAQMKNYPEINYAPCLMVYNRKNENLGEICLNEDTLLNELEKFYSFNI